MRWVPFILLTTSPLFANDVCPNTTVGLCAPGTTTEILDTITEITIDDNSDGVTTTWTTTETIEETTVTHSHSGNIMDSTLGVVSVQKDGNANYDMGGIGPIIHGTNCKNINDGKCGGLVGTGNYTSKLSGATNVGTTYSQTINLPDDYKVTTGGAIEYSIEVDKSGDAADNVYFFLKGNDADGNLAFSAHDILSESGVDSGYETYTNSFDFNNLSTVTLEIGGKNLGLYSTYPVWDNLTLDIYANVVNAIIMYNITTVTEFIAAEIIPIEDVSIDIIEDIFDNNDITLTDDGTVEITPIELPDVVNIETVELELEAMVEELPVIEVSGSMDKIEVSFSETEIEAELDLNAQEMEPEIEVTVSEEPEVAEVSEPEEKTEVKVEVKEKEVKVVEVKKEEPKVVSKEPEKKEEVKEVKKVEVKKKVTAQAKQKAANKIISKMGDKGRYSSENQMKELLVVTLLSSSKNFFEGQQQIQDIPGFFNNAELDGGVLNDNAFLAWQMFSGSSQVMAELTDIQWKLGQ